MQRIFLLRAYGDFVIAIQAIAKSDKKIMIIASDHLAPLYHALLAAEIIPPLNIEFIALGIQHGQLSFFTNKHIISIDTFKQLNLLKDFLKANPNPNGTDYLEHDIRLSLFKFIIGHDFEPVVPYSAKVYQAYSKWLDLEQDELDKDALQHHQLSHVLVIPDARLKKRVMQPELLELLKKYILFKGLEYKTARMRHKIAATDLVYDNFEDLIQLIQTADFIVCTDSLPAHLAYLLKKPHYILYPKKGMTHFFTPFALANNAVSNFDQTHFTFLNNQLAC